MKEIRGNLWDHWESGEWICITVNGFIKKNGALVMGRGCAKEARDRIPGIDRQLGRFVLGYGNVPFDLPSKRIITFPVKWHYKERADLTLIGKSAKTVKRIVETYNLKRIIIPRPGCGHGHLDWSDVKPVLEKIFDDDRFLIITFPEPPESLGSWNREWPSREWEKNQGLKYSPKSTII